MERAHRYFSQETMVDAYEACYVGLIGMSRDEPDDLRSPPEVDCGITVMKPLFPGDGNEDREQGSRGLCCLLRAEAVHHRLRKAELVEQVRPRDRHSPGGWPLPGPDPNLSAHGG